MLSKRCVFKKFLKLSQLSPSQQVEEGYRIFTKTVLQGYGLGKVAGLVRGTQASARLSNLLKKGSSAVANSRVGKAFVNGCKKVAGVSYHQPDNVALYPKLKKDLTLRQFTNVTKTTQHGIERLIERGFSPIDIIELKTAPDIIMTQQDGAKVFIKSYNGKFNIIVEGDNGIITSLKGLSKDALDKLEKNYNWRKNG